MSKKNIYCLATVLSVLANPAIAQETLYSFNEPDSMAQINSVSQLRDVSPTDWAFEALRSLVERYGCIVGYPDRTYRGNRALSRYEFAAGLNACMQQMERLIAQSESVLKEDIETLKRLMAEFETELAALGTRVDNLEGRVAFLEDHQFSTTTKLGGEVAFTLAQAFGDKVTNPNTGISEDLDTQAVLTTRVRLQLATSFTGKDVLFTRLTAGNLGASFAGQTFTDEGRFAYDGQLNNDVTIDRLHYYFPINDNLRMFVMASLGGHHFYADTFNPGLEAGGGANGALSRFAERNPLYRLGLGGQGVGFRYKLGTNFELSAGYLARGGNDPSEGRGLFNGNYSAMGQLVYKPTDRIKFGFSYLNGYDPNGVGSAFSFGGTGTRFANLQLTGLGVPNRPISSNSYGLQGQFDITPNFSLRAWGGYTSAKLIGLGEGEIWNYALALAFPDLGKEGSMGAIIVGAEPYLGGLDVPQNPRLINDTPLNVEVSYKYPLTDNITLTPGLIVLAAPNQNSGRNDPIYIGTIRTTFTF
ncbi:iron uptake porin [Cyanobacterium aponinum UTEX 3221]|uniref:iron uptake porin n=1 Tax=Cyanobacterium aponinum TaxID=379064 RepID=UPI002B4BC322|nr:iron uptake porin [Cyanobacterium aponinum]WRL37604.1 iron uptake porin [Cyanobacterium aponinum UTEX 3221]